MPVNNATEDEIASILKNYNTIAVIGMSNNPEKDAYTIPAYMKSKGYRVIPVNPTADRIQGEKSYKTLSEVPENVDIVDMFRPSEEIPKFVDEVIAKKPKVFWLQLGIHNEAAEEKVANAGIKVVYDRCIFQEHRKLSMQGKI